MTEQQTQDPSAALDELAKIDAELGITDAGTENELVDTTTQPFVGNKFAVPADVWDSWSEAAQQVFNRLYWYMLQNQTLFKHPKSPVLEHEQWKTTAWNAAWIAANAVDGK